MQEKYLSISYTYSDSSSVALKSEQADLVVSAIERFSKLIPLNIQEIFTWYFEQKGVDNPERFLSAGVNGLNGVNGGDVNNIAPQPQGLIANAQQNLGTEQFVGLLNKVLDNVGSKEKNKLEMLTGLKKLRKEK